MRLEQNQKKRGCELYYSTGASRATGTVLYNGTVADVIANDGGRMRSEVGCRALSLRNIACFEGVTFLAVRFHHSRHSRPHVLSRGFPG